jgi:Zinc carboxypeptidase
VTFLAYSLVTDKSARMKSLLDKITFVIVPIVNPDGYEYTWTTDRLWRKNRKSYVSPYVGVDLNRNWDSFFNTSGASKDPSSDTYQGPFAASELETKACQTFYLTFAKQLIGALDIHSYSQLLLWPWSYTATPYKYRKEHQIIGKKMSNAIKLAGGRSYVAEDSSALYPSGGAAQDFFCDTKFWSQFTTVPYAFTIELRPTPPRFGSGFIVPPSQIIETGEEVLAGLVVFSENAYESPIFA